MYNEDFWLSCLYPEDANHEAIDRFVTQLILAYGSAQRSCVTLAWACIRILLCESEAEVVKTVRMLFQAKAPYVSMQDTLCGNPLLARYFAQSVLNYLISEAPWRLDLYEWTYLSVEAQLLCYNCFDEQVRRDVLSDIQQVRDSIWGHAHDRGQSIRIALNQAVVLKEVLEEDCELCFRRVNDNDDNVDDKADTCLRLAVAIAKAYEIMQSESDAVVIETAVRILGLETSVILAYQLIQMMPGIYYETNVTCVNEKDIAGMSIEYLPILAPFCNDANMADWGADRQLVNAAIPVADAVMWAACALHISQYEAWDRQSFFQIAAPDMDTELCAPPMMVSDIMLDVDADGVYVTIYDNDHIGSFFTSFATPAKLSITALVHSIKQIERQITNWFINKYLVFGCPTIVYPACISENDGKDICAAFQNMGNCLAPRLKRIVNV